jgi:hypothetical protein
MIFIHGEFQVIASMLFHYFSSLNDLGFSPNFISKPGYYADAGFLQKN